MLIAQQAILRPESINVPKLKKLTKSKVELLVTLMLREFRHVRKSRK